MSTESATASVLLDMVCGWIRELDEHMEDVQTPTRGQIVVIRGVAMMRHQLAKIYPAEEQAHECGEDTWRERPAVPEHK